MVELLLRALAHLNEQAFKVGRLRDHREERMRLNRYEEWIEVNSEQWGGKSDGKGLGGSTTFTTQGERIE